MTDDSLVRLLRVMSYDPRLTPDEQEAAGICLRIITRKKETKELIKKALRMALHEVGHL